MLPFIRNKIAVKLSLIISGIVVVISVLFTLYMNDINTAKSKKELKRTISKITEFIELAYVDPLWNLNKEVIERLTEGMLNTTEVIAVNVFNDEGFFSGYQKIEKNNDLIKVNLLRPYTPSGTDLLQEKGNIVRGNHVVGRFELYYTERYLLEEMNSVKLNNIYFFVFLAILIIITIVTVTKYIIINPVIDLADLTKKIAKEKEYSIKVEKKGDDELSSLYQAFDDMITQINVKENEREILYGELKQSEKDYRDFFSELKRAVDAEDYSIKNKFNSKNIELATSLNTILSTLQISSTENKNQNWLKSGQTKLSNLINGERQIEKLCQNAVTFTAEYLGVQIATIYIKNDDDESYQLSATYALKKERGKKDKFKVGEGLVGQVALTKKHLVLDEIPENYLKIESSFGEISPHSILIFPLIYENNVRGVIELGSLSKFTPLQIEFCKIISNIIAVVMNAAIFNNQLQELLIKTKEQAEKLKTQQDKLQITNEELQKQTKILKESEKMLQSQQEELQVSNEEMEEKNEILEKQKEEIEKKNEILREKQIELKEKARQLELSTKYKSEFLANMSHELRTPLNSLLLLAKILSDNEENNLSKDQIESVSSIYRSGKNLLRLINDILDLSKIEARKIELDIIKFKTATLISNIEGEFKHVASNKGLKFYTVLNENAPQYLISDMHRLEQIIRNLVGNSLKFTNTGFVSIEIGKADPTVRLTRNDLDLRKSIAIKVADSGPGIALEKQQLIFEAFKQVDGSISRTHGGTGLGLSISKELIYLIGGEITVSSTLGKGAVFTIYLPEIYSAHIVETAKNGSFHNHLHFEQRTPLAMEKKEEEEKIIYSDNNTILIIEDDNDFAGVIADFAQEEGYKYIIASDGETGIEYAYKYKPIAIVLDIGLPGIDGWKVLDELKNNPMTRYIPIHIMSGRDSDKKKEILLKGAVAYLQKPVSIEDIMKTFNKIKVDKEKKVKELLIVEDNQELRSSILKLMNTNDINATTCGSGEKAFELLSKNKFDCVILDLGLPDISGFELLDRIDLAEEINKPPIIIYTGKELTREETIKLNNYSNSIILKKAASFDRLLDEAALFMHRVESELPKSQQQIIDSIRDEKSILNKKRILIVDDDMRNAFALNKFLKSKGMIITIANNGQKALEILKKDDQPDIILMDIMMPVMDGYETIKRIRKQKQLKNIPILALTAKVMESDRKKCIECGASDYLAKPVDIPKLISMLTVWLY